MWTETDTGHWRFENPLDISVVISPRDVEGETWRYRVADEKFTAIGSTRFEDVQACALAILKVKLHAFLHSF